MFFQHPLPVGSGFKVLLRFCLVFPCSKTIVEFHISDCREQTKKCIILTTATIDSKKLVKLNDTRVPRVRVQCPNVFQVALVVRLWGERGRISSISFECGERKNRARPATNLSLALFSLVHRVIEYLPSSSSPSVKPSINGIDSRSN